MRKKWAYWQLRNNASRRWNHPWNEQGTQLIPCSRNNSQCEKGWGESRKWNNCTISASTTVCTPVIRMCLCVVYSQHQTTRVFREIIYSVVFLEIIWHVNQIWKQMCKNGVLVVVFAKEWLMIISWQSRKHNLIGVFRDVARLRKNIRTTGHQVPRVMWAQSFCHSLESLQNSIFTLNIEVHSEKI